MEHLKKDAPPAEKEDARRFNGRSVESVSCSACRSDTIRDSEKRRWESNSGTEKDANAYSSSSNSSRNSGSVNIQRKKIQYMQTRGLPASVEVNLRLGYPAPADLPIEALRKATAAKMQEDDADFFMYGVAPGFFEFREQLANFLTEHYGYDVNPEYLMATNGSAGGLDLLCRMCTQPGDEIFIENPTYFLAYPTFSDYHLRPVAVDLEADGVDMQAFEDLLQKHKPKFFYTVPVAHNPTGRTTSAAKREKLVELAVKHGFKIVADEVYQLLCFDGKDIPPSFSFFDSPDAPCVFSLGSFSKILAPALRLGWIQAHPTLLKPLLQCGLIQSGGCLNPVMCGLAQKAIELGYLKENILRNRQALQIRCDTLKRALQTYFPPNSISFEDPVGGYFVLVKLPQDVMSLKLLREAEANHRVSFLAGTHFGKGYDNYIRLSFSYYSPEDIELGVKRLAAALGALLQQQQQPQQQPQQHPPPPR